MVGRAPLRSDDAVFPVERLTRERPTSDHWAVDPAPIADELLSSWLSRLAWAHAMSLDALLRSLRIPLGRDAVDVDAKSMPWLIRTLEQRTGLPRLQLEALLRFAHPSGNLWAKLLRPPRFCPHCWAEDTSPYVRWRWRALSFLVCVQHAVWLCHRCPACRSPLSLLRGDVRRPLWRCVCGQDLKAARPDQASEAAVRGQTLILDITQLAEEIEREDIVKRLLNSLHNSNVRKQGPFRFSPSALTSLGRTWGQAYGLLDGIPYGGVRTQLLRVLHGGSIEAALVTEPLPTRCWAEFKPDVEKPKRALGHVSFYDLLLAYANHRGTVYRVRWAGERDIGLFKKFYKDKFCHDRNIPRNSMYQIDDIISPVVDAGENLFKVIMSQRAPMLLAEHGSEIAGYLLDDYRKIMVSVLPSGKDFIPVLLEGIAVFAASHRLQQLVRLVHDEHRSFFEEAGWRGDGRDVRPEWSRMELDLTTFNPRQPASGGGKETKPNQLRRPDKRKPNVDGTGPHQTRSHSKGGHG